MVVIRKMNEQDISDVKEVAKVSWHSTYEGIIPRQVQDQFLAQAYNEDMLQRRLKHSQFYVAEIEREVVGYSNFSNVKEVGEVELGAIYILPQSQGLGIGTALLNRGIEDLNPSAIYLNVERDNEIGKRFYTAKGFEVIDEFEEDFAGNKLQTLRMRLLIK